MQRYFVMNQLTDQKVNIVGEDVHHITRVMRYKIGDKIICNDPTGNASLCEIVKIEKDHVEAFVLENLDENKELPVAVAIAQGIPKGDKFDFVIQKGTELGASFFIPFQAERSVTEWDEKKAAKKIARFQKIAKEASEQCHRNKLPAIYKPMNLKNIIEISSDFDVKLFAYEEEAKTDNFQSFGQILRQIEVGQKVFICIGPEGGFSQMEVEQMKVNDFLSIRLGPRILRSETAPLYVLSAISYHFEELDL